MDDFFGDVDHNYNREGNNEHVGDEHDDAHDDPYDSSNSDDELAMTMRIPAKAACRFGLTSC